MNSPLVFLATFLIFCSCQNINTGQSISSFNEENQVCLEEKQTKTFSLEVNKAEQKLKNDFPMCNEEVFYFSRFQLGFLLRSLLLFIHHVIAPFDIISNTLDGEYENPTRFKTKYGIRAVKVCAKCEDFFQTVGESPRKSFDDYCGKDVYGNNETMTGTVMFPIDHEGTLRKGELEIVIWMHGFDLEGKGPSESFPRSVFSFVKTGIQSIVTQMIYGIDKVRTTNQQAKSIVLNNGAMMMASRGIVVILPDYIGYGNDKNLKKGTGMKRAYQTSSIPLYLKTKELLQKNLKPPIFPDDPNKQKHRKKVYVSGFSEGGYATLAVAEAISNLGVETHAFAGGLPMLDTVYEKMRDILHLMNGEYQYPNFYSMWNIAMTSSSPHNDLDSSESIFSSLGDVEIPNIVNSNRSVFEMASLVQKGFESNAPDCLKNGVDCPKYLNPILIAQMLKISSFDPLSNPEYFPCKSKNPSPNLEPLCKTLKSLDVKHMIVNADYPIDICHSPGDKLTIFRRNEYDEILGANKNVKLEPSEEAWKAEEDKGWNYDHAPSGIVCLMINTLKILKDIEGF